MSFQVQGLPLEKFSHLFSLSDAELARQNILRSIVTESPGTPCRVSLQDAEPGESVIQMYFEDSGIAYLHLHNAREGCFHSTVERSL